MPGYYLGGNLYRPLKPAPPAVSPPSPRRTATGPTAASSIPCSRPCRRAASISRSRATSSFCYDMVGYNDTIQTPHDFGTPAEQLWDFGSLSLQLWNSIRVVDFLQSLPGVNASQIGATGASGRRHADLPPRGDRRPHPVLRARQHDLRHHAGRRPLRECAQPAPGHLQRGDRRDDGAAPHDHGLRHRRLDEEQRSPKSSPPIHAIYELYDKRRQRGEHAPGRAAQLQPAGARGGLPLLRQARARRDRRRQVQGTQHPRRKTPGHARPAQPHAAGQRTGLRRDLRAVGAHRAERSSTRSRTAASCAR